VVEKNRSGQGETTIVESNRIVEYLEDRNLAQAPIFASDPLQRAGHKDVTRVNQPVASWQPGGLK
jgi:glutathione S-transferase